MIWIFISLGSITMVASLLGLATVWIVRRPLAAWHGLVIVLLAVAWLAEHTTLSGRLCLVAAAAVEALAWWAFRSSVRAASASGGQADASPPSSLARPGSEPPAPLEGPPDIAVPDAPRSEAAASSIDRLSREPADIAPCSDSAHPAVSPPDREPEFRITTCVLLRSACTVVPAVLLASLRRCGQRDATLAPAAPDGETDARGDDDGPCRIVAGDIVLACKSAAVPVDHVRISEALSRREGAAPATEAAGEHVAHIAVTTTHRMTVARDDVVRLHHHAHAALTEFAPVAASFWPEARLLATRDELPGLLAQAKDPTARMSGTCTQVRRFSLQAPNEGMILLDSLGLSAFGLPDIQIIVGDPPGEAVMAALADLVDRFFDSGCTLEDGSAFEMGDRTSWRVSHVRSAFAPDRQVVQLAV